jgi:hypothetical protein
MYFRQHIMFFTRALEPPLQYPEGSDPLSLLSKSNVIKYRSISDFFSVLFATWKIENALQARIKIIKFVLLSRDMLISSATKIVSFS